MTTRYQPVHILIFLRWPVFYKYVGVTNCASTYTAFWMQLGFNNLFPKRNGVSMGRDIYACQRQLFCIGLMNHCVLLLCERQLWVKNEILCSSGILGVCVKMFEDARTETYWWQTLKLYSPGWFIFISPVIAALPCIFQFLGLPPEHCRVLRLFSSDAL